MKDRIDTLVIQDLTFIFGLNMIKRYARRPAELENMCLADFVSKINHTHLT